jgi:hypothetical protein
MKIKPSGTDSLTQIARVVGVAVRSDQSLAE